jgi:hypothetical protein
MPRKNIGTPSLATWIVGSVLFCFFVYVFVLAPAELPEFKHKMVGLVSAFLAGIFAFLFTGDLSIRFESKSSPLGRVLAKGTGGAAVFLLILWWWFSSAAPVAPVRVGEVRGVVRYSLARDPLDHEGGKPLLPLPKDMFVSATELAIVAKPPERDWPPKLWTIGLPTGSGAKINIKSNTVISKEDNIVPTEIGPVPVLVRAYGSFTGARGAFGSPVAWRKAAIPMAAVVADRTQEVDAWFANLETITQNEAKRFKAQFFKSYGEWSDAMEGAGTFVTPYPVSAHLCIYLDGEVAASLMGYVSRVRRDADDVRQPFITLFRQQPHSDEKNC